jgi:hypothetical protein
MKLNKFNALVAVTEICKNFRRIPAARVLVESEPENMIVELATSLTSILETRDLESKQLKNRR